MPANTWIVGAVPALTLTAQDRTGAPADPDDLLLRVKAPSGTVTVYTYGQDATVIRDGVGSYHADIPLTAAGRWHWRWECSGTIAGPAEGTLYCQASQVLPA